MTEFCALSHAESARRVVQTPAIFSTQRIQVIGILRDQDLSIDVDAILANASLYAQDKSVFNSFFPDYNENLIKYEDFKAKLLEGPHGHGVFTLNAIEEAVRTALRAGPVDNEQFFCRRKMTFSE